MKEILTALMIWLGANTPFDTNHDIPNILFVTQAQMEEMFYKGSNKMPNTLHGPVSYTHLTLPTILLV